MRWILDTDPGVDDAAAIIGAIVGGLDVAAISIVHGNSPLECTLRNGLRIKELLNSSVKVYRGASKPLLEPPQNAAKVHGEDGLGDTNWPPLRSGHEDMDAVDMLCAMSKRYAGELGVLAVGPLTNLAIALAKDPSVAQGIARLVIMGGTSGARGNATMVGEFNFAADPEAAAIVLRSGIPIMVVPWETTLAAPIRVEELSKEASRTRVGQKFMEISNRLREYAKERFGEPVLLLCDFVAAAIILQPAIVLKSTEVYAAVETSGVYGRGLLALDYAGVSGKKPNITLIEKVDVPALTRLFDQSLAPKRQ